MTSDDKRKPEQKDDQVLVAPERIDATVDEVLDKLFNTTPEQIEKWDKHNPTRKDNDEHRTATQGTTNEYAG